MRRPLVWVASAFALGVAGQGLLPPLAWWLLTASGLLITGIMPTRSAMVAILVAMMGLGAMAAVVDQRVPGDQYLQVAGPGPAVLEGLVVSDPERRVMAGPVTQQAIVAVTAVGAEAGSPRASGRLWLRHHQPAFPLQYGDRVRLHGVVRLPRPAQVPGAFDEQRWLWVQGVAGVAEAGRGDVEWLAPAHGWPRVLRALFQIKHRALALMRQLVDPPTAALVSALLAGDRTGLSRDTTALFINTGTVHVLSVSGWHVTLIGGMLWALARAVRLARRAAAVTTMVGLLLYCVLTGAQPPIVRATIMGLVVLAGWCLTRPPDPLNSIGLAALLILPCFPRALWDVGFQLSFASVIALLTLAPIGMAVGRRLLAGRALWHRWLLGLLEALVVSTAAWLGTWPLVAYHLHRLTPVTWLANLLAIPLAALVMITGLVVLLGAWWHPWLILPWAGATQLVTHTLLSVLGGCAALPGATLACAAPPWWGLLGWYLALGLATLAVNRTHFLLDRPKTP